MMIIVITIMTCYLDHSCHAHEQRVTRALCMYARPSLRLLVCSQECLKLFINSLRTVYASHFDIEPREYVRQSR